MKSITIKYSALMLSLFVLLMACEKERAVSPATVDSEFFNAEGDIPKMYVSLGAATNSAGGYLDIGSGAIYTTDEIAGHYHEVDLAYTFESSSGNNLLALDAKNISVDLIGEQIEYTLPYKNKGEMFLYRGASDADKEWFLSLETAATVRHGYDSLISVLAQEAGEVPPLKRVSNLEVGDIVLFHSINRNIKSILLVESIATSTNGQMRLSVKSDVTEQVYFDNPGLPLKSLTMIADTLVLETGARTSENYLDLIRRKVYKDVDLINDDVSQIQILHTFDGTATVFYTLTSAWIANSGYRPELWNWLQTLPDRRTVQLHRLDNYPAYTVGSTFEDVRNNNNDLKEYGTAMLPNVGPWTSRVPSQTGQSAAPGMVFLIRDTGNDLWGLIKVLSIEADGTCTIVVKHAK